MTPPFLVIGHPDNRRVADFCAAVRARGLPQPDLRSHLELLEAPERLLELDDSPRFVRIDAFGEDPAVERHLLGLGYPDAVAAGTWAIAPDALARREIAHGEVVAPRQAGFGLVRQLERLQAVFDQRPQWRILQPTAAVARLFDKRACWRMHHKLPVTVPEAAVEVTDVESLRAEAKVRGWKTVYVKLLSGSSASCLAVYEPRRERLVTSLARDGDRWFNELVLSTYQGAEAEPVLDFLVREGVHAEHGLPKARMDNRYIDLRVLTVAGKAAFAVVRKSPHLITNLHLGGQRGDLDALRALIGPEWARIEATAETVAAAHGTFHLGVDIAVLRGLRDHAVIEANAFGDLLPNLEREGLSVYAWQVQQLLDGL